MRAFLLLFLILVSSGPAAAGTIQVILRTFIPSTHPSKPGYMLGVPNKPGHFMLPKQFSVGPSAVVGACFATDDRTFSTARDASSRFGGIIVIDTDTLTASFKPITGRTTEFDCDTGATRCDKVAGAGGFKLTENTMSGDKLTVAYTGEASNPCLPVAPDIEFTGHIVVDRTKRTVAVVGLVDVFPSFEAILVRPDGSSVFLYKVDPADGAVPTDLSKSSGGGSRPVKSLVIGF